MPLNASDASSADRLTELVSFPVRDDLSAAYERGWQHLARPGTWLDGERRLSIAAESRNALTCRLCRTRADALSPYAIDGTHDDLGALPVPVVEVIHRIRTDSGRLSEAWYRKGLDGGLSETDYVEIVAVLSITTALDTLARGLGVPMRTLPRPEGGDPTRHRPKGAKPGLAWVATLEQEDLADIDPDPYPGKTPDLVANIHRAMSLVPAEVAAFFALDDVIYLPQWAMKDFSTEFRAITNPQIELLAARVSMINRCTY